MLDVDADLEIELVPALGSPSAADLPIAPAANRGAFEDTPPR
jgi:hypothetical protein